MIDMKNTCCYTVNKLSNSIKYLLSILLVFIRFKFISF